MDNLTVLNQNGHLVTDSREVSEVTGIRHDNLLAKIKGYSNILTTSNLRALDFGYVNIMGKTFKQP